MPKDSTKKIQDTLIALGTSNTKYEFKKPLEQKIKYKGKQIEVKIFEEPDGFSYIVWKNKKYLLDVIEKNQNRYTVMINGVWYSFSVETPISFKRKKYLEKHGEGSKKAVLYAPMPGKIIDVLVEEGQEIKEGEPVIILEAMKMQNEITSSVSGTVKSIPVKKEDSVMKDDILLEIARG